MALALARNAPINEMRSPGLIGFPLLLLWKNARYFSKKLRPKFQHVRGSSRPTLDNSRGHVSTKMAALSEYTRRCYSTRTNLMTAPDGFCVSTSAFPFTANSYRLPAPPMANALFATMAFVASTLPVTVYVPVLR